MLHVTLTEKETGNQHTYSAESHEDLAQKVAADLRDIPTDRTRIVDDAGWPRGWVDNSGTWAAR